VLLQEEEDKLREHALIKLVDVVDEHWAEVSEQIALIETLAEDETFDQHELAASVASRCFYHLEEYDDALRLALASGKHFDVGSSQEYEVTIVGKCIDRYVALRAEEADVDPRLEAIVEGMFEKCYSIGTYKQALGIALEAHRLDKVKDAITRSGEQLSEMLTHCMAVSQQVVNNRKFRREVFQVLVGLYEDQSNRNYIEYTSALHYLGEAEKFALVLLELAEASDQTKNLMAYQVAFDLNELQDQRFVGSVIETLKSKSGVKEQVGEEEATQARNSETADGRVATLCEILGEGLSTAMYLDFLYRNNKTDPLLLKQIKQAVEQGRKNSVLHNATIVAHGYLQAGTSVDRFLRDNLEWLKRATNWSKFSATASLGVIHKGNVKPSMELLEPYLPSELSSGVSQSPYSEGGALYALGLIHACEGSSSKDGTSALKYLTDVVDTSGNLENETAREALQHGACLGLGLVAMSSGDDELTKVLQNIVYNDNAVAGEAAALAMGMIMLGGGSAHDSFVEDMLTYSKDTAHEKITRGLGLAVAMVMYGQEEAADTLIEQLCRDKDPLLRYGGMYTIGMAYAGTANNKAIRRLLHVAVSDVNNDVRRAAVTSLGFLIVNVPERLPELIALLSESYNPHVRNGACMALAIGCSQMDDPSEALQLLEHLKEDKVDFVRQGAYIASSMLLMQENPAVNTRAAALRTKLSETIADAKHSPTMARMGAILGTGILDAGGRNVTIELMSRTGFTKPPAVVGMMLWAQYWYWYPMMHMLSLSFVPTALIGVNVHLDMPVDFAVDCDADLKEFEYPKPLEEKKEKKQVRVKTAVLSTTAKSKARQALKNTDSSTSMEVDDDDSDEKKEELAEKEEAESKAKADAEAIATKLTNPLRVTRKQSNVIKFKTDADQRYTPVYTKGTHKTGIVVLKNNAPDEPEDVVKVAVPPTGGDDDDGDNAVPPPEPFEWTEP